MNKVVKEKSKRNEQTQYHQSEVGKQAARYPSASEFGACSQHVALFKLQCNKRMNALVVCGLSLAISSFSPLNITTNLTSERMAYCR